MPRKRKSRPKKADPRYRHLKRYQFKPGQLGNPKGRPKGSRNKVNHRLALEKLVQIMKSKRTPAAVQIKAAEIILDLSLQAAGLVE